MLATRDPRPLRLAVKSLALRNSVARTKGGEGKKKEGDLFLFRPSLLRRYLKDGKDKKDQPIK